MATSDKVTVERSYFEALLRRADFHASNQLLGHQDPTVAISRIEYDGLLRTAREYDVLRSALLSGGITEETLDTLISSAESTEYRKDSGISDLWNQEPNSGRPSASGCTPGAGVAAAYREMQWRNGVPRPAFNLAPGSAPYPNSNLQHLQSHLRVPSLQRQASYGMSSIPDDTASDEDNDFIDDANQTNTECNGLPTNNNERRTLYFSGFSDRTTYQDLLSVIKGGKLLSINMRSERSAIVTFLDGAAEFLAWTKRNDIYLHSKRIEVKWASHQFHLNAHISNKISQGATRNLIIHSALEKGLTESQVRADMEHIHNLVIVDISFNKAGDAYVSTNSVHNALFARTCMMSRREYKGCRVGFWGDECDVPLPLGRSFRAPKPLVPATAKQKTMKLTAVANRFDMLNMDGSSDEENRTPSDENDSEDDETTNLGVSLNFLDSDST